MTMFCNQCQEAAKGVGCTVFGVCGKSPELTALMDTFIYSLIGLSCLALEVKEEKELVREVDLFVTEGLFATITNANFDEEEFVTRIKESIRLRNQLKERLIHTNLPILTHDIVNFEVDHKQSMIKKALSVAIHSTTENEDIRSLRELILFGLKGLAAYTSHAEKLGFTDDELFNNLHRFMATLIQPDLDVSAYTTLALELGNVGVLAMSLLDQANTSSFGHPELTKVNIGVQKRPGILITGHDLHDLKQLFMPKSSRFR